jgi:hypothetical protein
MAATGSDFAYFEEGGARDTGCTLATTDEEIRKMDPVPAGCGENSGHTFVVVLESGAATVFELRLV